MFAPHLKNLATELFLKGADQQLGCGKLFRYIKWRNIGIAPTYENWDVVFEFVHNNNVTVDCVSQFKPKRFVPAATASSITDTYVLPSYIENWKL
jgi:hypothetical protein